MGIRNHERTTIGVPYPFQLAVVLMALIAGVTRDAKAAEVYLPPIGGSGGGQFFAPCPAGQNLTGFELRAGADVDAIRPLCVTAYGSGSVTLPQLTNGSGLVQHYASASREVLGEPYSEFLGDWSELPSDWHGGVGGGLANVICPHARPIVIGMYVAAEGVDTIVVNNIHLFCGLALPSQQLDPNPSAIFDAPGYRPSSPVVGIGGGSTPNLTSASQRCSDGQVAIGVHGRSGIYLDSMGLICDAPRVIPALALGRVPGTGNPGLPRPICDAAREARARNSPAAPNLEAQCQAIQPPAKSLGRVDPSSTASAPRSLCEAARDARARNSPAAPSLEAQCRAGDVQTIAAFGARGEGIANQDPLAVALRNQQTVGLGQRGFDIGMAAAEGNTAPGPGKQRIHDSLSPAEQRGFEAAVSFSLERNRNADLAARGATVARADPDVAQARNAEADVFYWLGFDIATGIFGDPALGALGEPEAAPKSLAIRDSLSVPGQRGFIASMAFHLNRAR